MSHHRPGILLKNLRFSSVLAKALIPTVLRKLEKIYQRRNMWKS